MEQAPLLDALRSRLPRFARPGIPKYVAMRDAIAHAIASGDWPERARLPTESEYAAALPLSLGTIQRALRALADDGIITRRPGQGSFVALRPDAQMRAPLHCRFLNDAGTAYLPVFSQVLARYNDPREGPWSRHLRCERVVCIERVLRIGSEFRVFGRFWFDPARLPALALAPARKLSGENFKEIIWRELHQPIGRISQLVSSVVLPPDARRAIGAKLGARGLLLEICAYIGRASPVYYQELYIPQNRRRLHLASDGREADLTASPR